MNKEINKIFEQWKQFLSWCYENNDKTTEIHRDNLERVMAYTRQLESIIKEAIEYINEMTLTSDGYASYGDDLIPEHIVDILKGSDKE